uniref:Fc receptor-like protein 4 n=1 Tax=Agelaius phoeniceus TaxID=39638 RepID=UPI0023EDD432|nr:Fc receptor-like protein 4 [Agelaius phoeniceus]
MAGKGALLLWAQTLSLAAPGGAPLEAAVLWDRVTLTCQGSGTPGVSTWYKDGQRWGQQGHDRLIVTERGTYTCDRPSTGRSPPLTISNDDLVLQVPARALLEGDTVTLRCQDWWNHTDTKVRIYRDKKDLWGPINGTELSLSHLQLNHSSSSYSCGGLLFSVPVLEGPPTPTEGSPLTLSCLSTPSPLLPRAPLLHVFYRDRQVVGGTQGSPQLLVVALGVSHSGNYSCQLHSEEGPCGIAAPGSVSRCAVCAGDNETLHCSVQVSSAPVTFTWLHNGQEVAQGPLLELRDINVGHLGTYQCMATNQLGQDGPCVFRVLSPELALEDTLGRRGWWGPFLPALLVGVIVAWHRWNRVGG